MTQQAQKLGNEQAFADGCSSGLTKREYFAAMAMSSIVIEYADFDKMAKDAVIAAEVLLEELSKTNHNE